MIPQYIKRLTTEQLKSRLKKTRVVVIVLIVMLSVLICASVYGLITKDNNPVFLSILVVGLFCFGTLPHQFKMMRKIKEEIESRRIIK
ncbi:hypothetical protein AAON49_12515 [Pseudotenacibaculum sp. MALMAid0570]|uniref:hypothetical protein n=1 Tax=Pseudotenacibaculum sp. MALMAid0570 TaxID=3143938 RepID=UPI0032DEBA4C